MILTWEEERQAEIRKIREQDKALEEQREQARRRAQESVSAGQECNPVTVYNEAVPIESALIQYGSIKKGKKFLSPNSSSGIPGAIVKDGKVLSHHSSDAGIGRPAPGGGIYADAFDLFCHFEHGGDYDRAVKAAGEMFTIHDPIMGDVVSLTQFNQREYMRQRSHIEVDYQQDMSNQQPAPPPARIITFDQIHQNNPQTEPLIKGFLNKGEGLLLHATGGLGKSMFTTWGAIQAATDNGSLFDLFPIKRRLISLFIQTENSAATVNSRIRLMAGNDPRAMDALKYIAMPLIGDDVLSPGRPFSNPGFKQWLTGTISAVSQHMGQAVDILWIDPLISFCNGDENDSAKTRLELDTLSQLCKDAGATPIIVHHDNRNGDYRGASAIFDWCRSMIGLKLEWIGSNRITDQGPDGEVTGTRTAPVSCIRMIHEKSNNMKKFDPILLRMNKRLNFEVIPESASPEQMEQGRLLQQALTDMKGQAESTNDLVKTYQALSGVSPATGRRHIKAAVDGGFMVRKSLILKGNQTYVYSLP